MEAQSSAPEAARAEVDTSRPFRSVKEAVAVFGERFLVGVDAYAPKPGPAIAKPFRSAPQKATTNAPIFSACYSPPSFSSSSSRFNQEREEEEEEEEEDTVIMSTLRKLEAELEETKRELKLLKERESDTEAALASLNAELRRSMSRVSELQDAKRAVRSSSEGLWGEEGSSSYEYLPSLAAALRLGEMDEKFGERKRTKALKRKPIVPLIGDMFLRKKDSADHFDHSLYNYSMQ